MEVEWAAVAVGWRPLAKLSKLKQLMPRTRVRRMCSCGHWMAFFTQVKQVKPVNGQNKGPQNLDRGILL